MPVPPVRLRYALGLDPSVDVIGVESHELPDFEEWDAPLLDESANEPLGHAEASRRLVGSEESIYPGASAWHRAAPGS